MKQLEQFSALLHTIYGGATDASAWSNILAAVSEWMGGEKGLLITSSLVLEKGGFAYTYRIPQSSITLWSTRYADQNLWLQAMVEQKVTATGAVGYGSDLVADQRLIESEWYQRVLAPDDILQMLFGLVFGADDPEIPLVSLVAFRGQYSAKFNDDDRAKVMLLLPHMSRALGVMFKLRNAEFRVAASLHALNQMRTGILLVNEQGSVCFANAEAERICRQQDGLRLKLGARSLSALHADDPIARSSIRHALRSAVRMDPKDVDHFAHAICVQRPSGLSSYSVQVSALPETSPYQLAHTIPRAIVFIKDCTQVAKPDAAILMQSYGLTSAEARLALVLSDGGSLESVAAELQVGVNTLKTHLKSVYSKMAVNSRAALTKLLVSLASH
jgi:DNA-binding CsgD family transcriptional regulator/PAS domain-containing protein